MFLLRLSSLGSSLLPCGSSPLCRAGLRGRFVVPAPCPWWSVQGLPPWPPPPPHLHPAAWQVVTGRTLQLHNLRGVHSGGGLLMERSSDREPPQKRRKSEEDGAGGGGGGGGGGVRKAKDGGSKRELHQLDPRVERGRQPNHLLRDRGGGGGGGGGGRDKDGDRTKTVSKDRPSRDGVPNQRWQKESQPGPGSRTQTPKSKPDQSSTPSHRPKPNPWFKGRGAEEQGGSTGEQRDQKNPQGTGRGEESMDGAAVSASLARRTSSTWNLVTCRTPGCSGSRETGGAAFDFSVVSYNILSQELLQDNSYLYRHCDPAVLSWEHRLPNLLSEVQQLDADILCLQEVQEDHYQDQIRPALQRLGYQCEYKKRTGNKPDGCAIIFKSSRLSLLSSNPVEFFRRGDALLDRDNVGLVLLLRPNHGPGRSDPSAFICVANTHLLYNPRRGDIKLAQLAILLAEIGRLSRRPDGSTNPVVLCGDFNSTPWSPLYHFLTTGRLKYRGLQISMVSGQEDVPRGQRLLTPPLWSQSLGINERCQYEDKPPADSAPPSPTAVEGAISSLTVDDVTTEAAAASHRARIEHTLKLRSSYQHILMPDGRPEITTCHSRTAMTVDYILFTQSSYPPLLSWWAWPPAVGPALAGRPIRAGGGQLSAQSASFIRPPPSARSLPPPLLMARVLAVSIR
ncbi:hypothetical protein INR49_008209 [Caranx melampygus]|nr:hypothetical protein INR49_008209 [Caranx melampygus]